MRHAESDPYPFARAFPCLGVFLCRAVVRLGAPVWSELAARIPASFHDAPIARARHVPIRHPLTHPVETGIPAPSAVSVWVHLRVLSPKGYATPPKLPTITFEPLATLSR